MSLSVNSFAAMEFLLAWFVWAAIGMAQEVWSTPEGLRQLDGRHLVLITDLPVDAEIQQMVLAFDAAMPQWAEYFSRPIDSFAEWKATAYVMGDRKRFTETGLLSPDLPAFPYGYQSGDKLYVVEQPSPYYRRHLLLHEGTHWIMHRLYDHAGPAWYMEGMAELLGTHQWADGRLRLAIMPERTEDVPYWGRVKLIREGLQAGKAPSLERILQYGLGAHREVEAYSYSWAAAVFFQHQSDCKALFDRFHRGPDHNPKQVNAFLRDRLKDDWSRLRMVWSGFLSDLDYGYDLDRAMPRVDRMPSGLGSDPVRATLRADWGWQSVGVLIQEGEQIEIRSVGNYVIGHERVDWTCEPQGITLQYHRGQPLGRLLAAVVPIPNSDPGATIPWDARPIGKQSQWTAAQAGVLMLKINESAARLSDNRGTLQVQVRRLP